MRTYIPLNTICADGRSIVMRRDEAFLEHRDDELRRLIAAELEHLATCAVCNPALEVTEALRALWPDVQIRE